ncbi:MAG: glutamate--tRNA ligase, partial [Bacilli bacterium]|nr:glutamate--tRNA ligase [Bacilli bacterium]
ITMTNKELADLIFPNIDKTPEDYEKLYPERNLREGAKVTRFAPSPTGFMHIGNMMSSVINFVLAKNSNGVFFVRNEDTDQARTLEGAVEFIHHTLNHYGLKPNEYEFNGELVGNYGPYIQSERKDIYHAFVKHLISIGRAYPCFLTKEEIDEIREYQTKSKKRIGIYGKYAKYRDLSPKEAAEKIKNGANFIIRFKSEGDYNKKFVFEDLTKGKIEFPENDLDVPIMKSGDLLPTYHFAHLVDDHLMHTTHVVRGEEWVSSVPLHYELFKAFGYKMPKYIHTSLILKKDGDTIRKISKRKDPEALMTFYEERGYPVLAVIDAVMTIANSNFEEWRTNHPDSPFYEFPFSPKKMSNGALFDLDKLDNISKNYISKMKAEELYNEYLKWAEKYDNHVYELISAHKEDTINFLNIEREIKKPRKDYENYFTMFSKIWYMYSEEWNRELNYEFSKINDKNEIISLMTEYLNNYYNIDDTQDEWFNKIKELCEKLGYASDMKAYKEHPENYKGSVADFTTAIRVVLTTSAMTPNLYDIMHILGKDRMLERLEIFKERY